ncbi:MAG: hypothetical protein CK424_02240 [Legionella sp.]|nr:MAG: hypothetical protein CK424_02240 [Legionella sp.]
MLNHSESTKVLGKQWMESNRSMAEATKRRKNGEEQIKKGYKDIKKGQELIAIGEKNVTAGRVLVEESIQSMKDSQTIQNNSEHKFQTYVSPVE